ncbi:MAG: hypothetical protein ABJA90_06640 [Ginsengibacter sp.]
MLLKEIRLHTKHLSALYTFYKQVMELPVVYLEDDTLSIGIGQSTLIFREADDNSNPFYHYAFNIPPGKFDEAIQWIQGRVPLLWLEDYKSNVADFVNWNAKSVYFLDPAGNILELIARFDLNDISTEVFSSKQLRNISEIGLVFPEESFDKDVNSLLNKYELGYFIKQPALKHFRAIGNDEGLFIAVIENRNWYATKMAAGIFPIEVAFIYDNKLFNLQLFVFFAMLFTNFFLL